MALDSLDAEIYLNVAVSRAIRASKAYTDEQIEKLRVEVERLAARVGELEGKLGGNS